MNPDENNTNTPGEQPAVPETPPVPDTPVAPEAPEAGQALRDPCPGLL